MTDPVERAFRNALRLLTPEQRQHVHEIKARPDRELPRDFSPKGRMVDGVRHCAHCHKRPALHGSRCRPCLKSYHRRKSQARRRAAA